MLKIMGVVNMTSIKSEIDLAAINKRLNDDFAYSAKEWFQVRDDARALLAHIAAQDEAYDRHVQWSMEVARGLDGVIATRDATIETRQRRIEELERDAAIREQWVRERNTLLLERTPAH